MLLRLVNLLGTGRVAEGKDFWERSGQKDQALAGPGSADPSKVIISLSAFKEPNLALNFRRRKFQDGRLRGEQPGK